MRQRKMRKLLLETAAALNNYKRAQESENQFLKEWEEKAEEREALEEKSKEILASINATLDSMEKFLEEEKNNGN